MFIQLDEWYYHSSMCGYKTRPLVINVDEISDFHETDDVDRGYKDAVKISLKNGRTYNVKETVKEIIEIMEKITLT